MDNRFALCIQSLDDSCIFEKCPLFKKCYPNKHVATAGGFDPLHYGHVRHILAAKELGSSLTVIVGTDKHMMMKKGFVFMPFEERVEIIKAIKGVDNVVASIDKDGTVTETLKWLKPGILAKGGDRTPETMPIREIEVCNQIGCQIVYGVGGEKIQSSSVLVAKIR